MKIWAPLLLLLVSLLALAAPLQIPHAPPAHALFGGGSSALWQGKGAPWFVIHTESDLVQGTGTVRRSDYMPGRAWRGPVQWDAALLLAETLPAERRIVTLDAETIPFSWADMPVSLRALLDTDGNGEARTSYLRGARDRELGQPEGLFRKRSQVLGDIVRSVPLIVGAPEGREMAVYVGANDGMLHAFSAATGKELFAYIPRLLHSALPPLSAPDYRPRALLDGSAAAREIDLGERRRMVLASGLGMGARGLFLLDVTDPATFGRDGGALWEFGTEDDARIGHIHAPPALARLPLSGTLAGREAAIVASGINPLEEDAPGALFLMALDKPITEPWQRDLNYVRIDTEGTGNTLSPPALVIGLDGTAIHAYAGDLDGNLWHFDLSTQRSRRVFTARAADGRKQSIAYAPQIVHAPGGGFLVIFGTGKVLEEDDVLPAANRIESLYGIHDVSGSGRAAIRSRGELAERTLAGSSDYTISGEALDYFLPHAKRGWYFDLPNGLREGERAAASPVAEGGVLVFQTVAPGAAAGQAMRHYFINAIDGTAVDPLASAKRDKRTGAVARADPLQPLIFISGGGTESARTPTGSVTVTRFIQLAPDGAGGSALRIPVSHQAGRLGWREVLNWQDLHEAARRRGG